MQHFDDVLAAARSQPDPQRLLLVFAARELPDDATPGQRAQFERAEGGAVVPVMCVDKRPDELIDFASLCEEAARTEQAWDMLFVGALAGRGDQSPGNEEVTSALEEMVEQIKVGNIQHYLAADRDGELVVLKAA